MPDIASLLVIGFFVRWLVYGAFTLETFVLWVISFIVSIVINGILGGMISRIFWWCMLVAMIKLTGDLGGEG